MDFPLPLKQVSSEVYVKSCLSVDIEAPFGG